jgi:hypothetical protein
LRGIDITIGVIIVLAIVFSGIGVATYEAAPQENDYTIIWSTETQSITPRSGVRTGNGAVNVDVPIDFDNMTEVTINVRVQGNGPRAQTVTAQVQLTPVNASAPPQQSISLPASPTGGGDDTEFVVKIQDLPTVTSISGRDENATNEELNNETRTETGSGIWKVAVTISNSGAPVGGVGGEAFTISVSGQVKTYKPTLAPATPDINR